jgi:TctA family transporter
VTTGFGLVGYLFSRLDLDPPPLILGFILGPMLEENFRRALLLSRGSFSTFVTRPISGTLVSLIGLFILWQVVSFFLQARKGGAPRQPSGDASPHVRQTAEGDEREGQIVTPPHAR